MALEDQTVQEVVYAFCLIIKFEVSFFVPLHISRRQCVVGFTGPPGFAGQPGAGPSSPGGQPGTKLESYRIQSKFI